MPTDLVAGRGIQKENPGGRQFLSPVGYPASSESMFPPRMCQGGAPGPAADFSSYHMIVLSGNLPPAICPWLAFVLLGMTTVAPWGMN